MKNFQFNRLFLLSETSRKARIVRFEVNSNAIVGTNHTGKSTISRSLFFAFGCNVRPFGNEWDKNAVTAVEFQIEDTAFTMLRSGGNFSLFDAAGSVIWVVSDESELREKMSDLLDFGLVLTANQTNEVRKARPAFFFVPFYIDQDGSWDAPWRTFQSLGEFRQWDVPTIDLALGIRSSEYWRKFGQLSERKHELENARTEQRVLTGTRDKLAKQFPSVPWHLDAISFRRELREFEAHASDLAIRQDALMGRVAEATATRDSLLAQVQLAEDALLSHSEDMQFLESFRVGASIECPTCGTEHINSFSERLKLEAEADELRQLRQSLVTRVRKAEKNLEEAQLDMFRVHDKAQRLDNYLDTEKNQIKLRDIIDRAGVDRAFSLIDSQNSEVDNSVVNLMKSIEALQTSLAGLEDKKHARKVKEYFNSCYSNFAAQLEVPASLSKRSGPVSRKPQQGGSGGPRAVLAYYFALSHTAAKYSKGIIPPLVIDSPHQKAQDEINRPIVTEFIFRNRVPGQQLIVGIEEDLPASIKLGNNDSATRLTEKFNLLREEDYLSAYICIQPLVHASREYLRSQSEAS